MFGKLRVESERQQSRIELHHGLNSVSKEHGFYCRRDLEVIMLSFRKEGKGELRR